MTKEIIETVKHNTAQIARIAFTLEEILRLVKEDQERSRKYMEEKKDEQKTWASNGPRIPAALAMAGGSRPKLQAPSGKLQASSFRVDKIKL